MRALDNVLRQRGHASFLFCQDSELRRSVREAHGFSSLLEAQWRKDDILIFHHSFYNHELQRLLDLPIRKVLVYHNITPSHFFRDANVIWVADACDAGRNQLFSIRDAVDVAVTNSEIQCHRACRERV